MNDFLPTTHTAQLALDTILQKSTRGIPGFWLHLMSHSLIERMAGAQPGSYRKDPENVYLAMQRAAGTCLLDQYIPKNPLEMEETGYEDGSTVHHSATAGTYEIICDGIRIDSPEAVASHLEQIEFPRLRKATLEFNEDQYVQNILAGERALQVKLGASILKSGYAFVSFPILDYYHYGYEHYFSTYALYPEIIEQHFTLQANYSLLQNQAAARAYLTGGLPPLFRLDHDIADSRGTLVNIKSLDKLWFPHFSRCLQPLIDADIHLIWHCDGNLMQMVPRLLEVGIRGFQGFQYEDGMDYERICTMKNRDGSSLTIIAGVSVTRTLPFGTPADVKQELAWLVEKGPRTGLFLGASSSITPGVPWVNIETLVQGLRYYCEHRRF
jgi:hypothetical protein